MQWDEHVTLPDIVADAATAAVGSNQITISDPFDGAVFAEIPHLHDSLRAVAIPLAVRDATPDAVALGAILIFIGELDILFAEETQLLSALAVAAALALSEASVLAERDKLFATARQNGQLLSIAEVAVGVSHDARNMLNNVTSAYRVAKKTIVDWPGVGKDPKLLAELKKMEDGLSTLRVYYDNLKQFSRHSAPVVAPHDINSIVRDGLMLVGHRLAENGIHLKRDLNGRRIVICDRDKLLQVIVNLVINAIEAMKPRGTLFVGTAEYGDGVEVRVTDDGVGIDDEFRSQIFKPLFTTKASGTGIGLAVCKQIVEGVHGGRLDFESRRGKGTTFYVRLPATPPGEVE